MLLAQPWVTKHQQSHWTHSLVGPRWESEGPLDSTEQYGDGDDRGGPHGPNRGARVEALPSQCGCSRPESRRGSGLRVGRSPGHPQRPGTTVRSEMTRGPPNTHRQRSSSAPRAPSPDRCWLPPRQPGPPLGSHDAQVTMDPRSEGFFFAPLNAFLFSSAPLAAGPPVHTVWATFLRPCSSLSGTCHSAVGRTSLVSSLSLLAVPLLT